MTQVGFNLVEMGLIYDAVCDEKMKCSCYNDVKYKSLSFASNDFTMGRRRF